MCPAACVSATKDEVRFLEVPLLWALRFRVKRAGGGGDWTPRREMGDLVRCDPMSHAAAAAAIVYCFSLSPCGPATRLVWQENAARVSEEEEEEKDRERVVSYDMHAWSYHFLW